MEPDNIIPTQFFYRGEPLKVYENIPSEPIGMHCIPRAIPNCSDFSFNCYPIFRNRKHKKRYNKMFEPGRRKRFFKKMVHSIEKGMSMTKALKIFKRSFTI